MSRLAGLLAAARAATARFAVAARDYLVRPIEGAVRNHVNAEELLDVLLAGFASGGLSNAAMALAQGAGRYLHGLTPAEVSVWVSLITMAGRLVQRYLDGAGNPPVRPA